MIPSTVIKHVRSSGSTAYNVAPIALQIYSTVYLTTEQFIRDTNHFTAMHPVLTVGISLRRLRIHPSRAVRSDMICATGCDYARFE